MATGGPLREPVDVGNRESTVASGIGGGVVGGSSTGAPAVPSPVPQDKYSREQSSYNPATGTGYTPRHPHEQTSTAAATVGNETRPSDSKDKDSAIGKSIAGTLAGIHGAGESIRGTFNAAIDRSFNDPEGVAKNEAIGRQGEYEVRTGQFAPSTKQREAFNAQNRGV